MLADNLVELAYLCHQSRIPIPKMTESQGMWNLNYLLKIGFQYVMNIRHLNYCQMCTK